MKEKTKGWVLNFCENDPVYLELSKEVIKFSSTPKYKIIKEYKNDKRSFIALIEYKEKKYILKFPYNESRIPQRKVMTLIKKGEALNTFERTRKYMEKGLDILSDVYAVGVKRKFGMIENSFMLIEYIEGRETQPNIKEDVDLLMEGLKKLHSYKIKHGDANPRNFMIEKSTNKLKVIDSQLKRDLIGIGRSYDYVNLSYSEVDNALEYLEKKGLTLKIAMFLKKFKKLKIVSEIKKLKKQLREKGWRI